MTYRDIPVLRSAGFQCGPSGYSWLARGWQAVVDDEFPGYITFVKPTRESVKMAREEFDATFS